MAPKVFKSILVLILILGLRGTGFAKEEKFTPKSPAPELTVKADEPKEEILEKTLDGEIAGVSPNFIAIIYGQDENTAYEITFNITKDTRLERIKNIKNLKPGDTVWVNYKEKVIKKGKEIRVKERILRVLRLLNAAKPVVEPPAPAENMVTETVE
ncbi:MAG: hypothetical protein Q8N22_00690 [bacterium]|nr:hypothetical protein [bacterium]